MQQSMARGCQSPPLALSLQTLLSLLLTSETKASPSGRYPVDEDGLARCHSESSWGLLLQHPFLPLTHPINAPETLG